MFHGKLLVEPPKWPTDFNFNPKDINVIQGFGAKLLCPAQGSPPPRIIWSKDGAVLTGNELGIILNDALHEVKFPCNLSLLLKYIFIHVFLSFWYLVELFMNYLTGNAFN